MRALLQVFMSVPGADQPVAIMSQPADFTSGELDTIKRALELYLLQNPGIVTARSSEFKINLAIAAYKKWLVQNR